MRNGALRKDFSIPVIAFEYKDSERYWWRLELTRFETNYDEDKSPDSDDEWRYALYKENTGGKSKWREHTVGFITGQYDIPPSVDEIMRNVVGQVVSLAIGFSHYPTRVRK